MTELQMGLIGLGATAVVAVLGYNKWQEVRQRKLAERLLKAGHSDVLLADGEPGEVEPMLAGDPPVGAPVDAVPDTAYDASPEFVAERSAPGLSGERIEPSLGGVEDSPPAPQIAAEPASVANHAEPVGDGESEATAPLRAAAEAAQPQPQPQLQSQSPSAGGERVLDELKDVGEPLHLLSPQVDYIAAFDAVEPVPAAHIVQASRAALARVRKAVHWIGYNEQGHEWEALVDDGPSPYRHFRAGLQLVDRRGPLGDSDLAQFHVAMQDFADQLAAIVDLPPRRTVLEAAAKLDAFCASVDIQIGINVVSQAQAFAGTKLRALAEAAGMVIDADGRFVRCDDEGNVLYVLLNQEAAGFSVDAMKSMVTHGLTFLLDVPRVAHGERVFNQMVEQARRFADVLRGALVDDNRRPLSEGALEPIRRQVADYQSMLAAQSLPAGGPLTRRLFS